MKVRGAVAVVTGASRGVGRATALALSKQGARVGLIARSRPELEELASQLHGESAIGIADVADRTALTNALDGLSEALGPPDILINNAGIGAYAPVLTEDPDQFERLMTVNYLGTVHATLAVLPGMAERRHGHIVNVASIAGLLGAPFEAAYSASKFAVVGFTESLAAEMAPFGVHLSLVNPGPVATHFTDARGVPFQRNVPRPQSPERIAEAIVRAIEHERFEQTLPRWLRIATVARAVSPSLYHRGLLRDAHREARSYLPE